MSKSEINFEVQLDDNDFPEAITWSATNKPGEKESTKAVSIAVWDSTEKETMRIDLWTKDMPMDEMRGFYINAPRRNGGERASVNRRLRDGRRDARALRAIL